MSLPLRRLGLIGGLVLAGLAIVFLFWVADWWVDLLWFRTLGYEERFWTLLLTRLGLFAAAFAVAFLYVWINIRILLRNIDLGRLLVQRGAGPPDRAGAAIRRAAVPVAGGVPALAVGLAFAANWDSWFRFANAVPFGTADPIYGLDIGFYVFVLPFLNMIQNWVLVLSFLVTLGLMMGYAFAGALRHGQRHGIEGDRPALWHLFANLTVLVLALAAGQYLARLYLLSENGGTLFGAGYTDVNVTLPAYWVTIGASLALVAVLAWAAAKARPTMGLIAVGGYFVIVFVALVLAPAAVQRFVVEPNELALERPYIRHNIAFTRQAYALDEIEVRSYSPSADLTMADIRDNEATINNIRLWDYRPLAQTFRQLQQIRAYYDFVDLDIDRYDIAGNYTQVILSGRELAPELPGQADTWVNQHLQYTHGYGLAMSPTSRKGPDGAPVLIVRDLPPVTPPGITIERPAIYYGEGMPAYRIVDTGVREFHYPQGDDNVYTNYEGTGGIPMGSLVRKALFAWHQSDISILLSGYIQDGSRIQLWRVIEERVAKVAPFLRRDRDPYLVVADGRLFYIQDTYTTASGYPYSEPAEQGFSYLRNSVKVVVDAYNGDVSLYVVDPDDPVINVYRRVFPDLFQPIDAMPESLRAHLRYPVDLFKVQIEKYSTYHMTVPQVFYNREDVWAVPRERYAGEAIQVEPYYILMRLPDTERVEFLLMLPLTPTNRDNMIAWVAARSDPPHYGEMLVYKLPKERLILGPIQIEAMINQDTLISQQLSLWDQRGSSVTRGNLLVIPINEAFLYVEPVYLRAEGTDIPQLKRVIVSDGERLAMEPTLEGALRVVFGEAPQTAVAEGPATALEQRVRPEALSAAREALAQAEEALEDGQWQAFGDQMQRLKELLTPPAPQATQ